MCGIAGLWAPRLDGPERLALVSGMVARLRHRGPSGEALWGGDGLALGRQVFIENGVLKTLYYSRFWAQKKGVQPTGVPTSFLMSGGTSSVDDMIKSTERGILVTRLWYLREVDPRTRSHASCTIGPTITGIFSAPSARLYERICVTSALARLPAPMMVSR